MKNVVVFSDFPKIRPPLPPKHQEVISDEYSLNRDGKRPFIGKIIVKLEEWMHRRVASTKKDGDELLEQGSATFNHVRFESNFSRYDAIEPNAEYFTFVPGSFEKTNDLFSDIDQLNPTQKYDRVFSVAVLEHMIDLPYDVSKAALALKKDGMFQAGIPCEGHFVWGLSWRLTSAVSFWIRRKMSYTPIIRHEHVNTRKEILKVIRTFFDDVKIQSFPLPVATFAFYSYIEAKKPNITKIKAYLDARV